MTVVVMGTKTTAAEAQKAVDAIREVIPTDYLCVALQSGTIEQLNGRRDDQRSFRIDPEALKTLQEQLRQEIPAFVELAWFASSDALGEDRAQEPGLREATGLSASVDLDFDPAQSKALAQRILTHLEVPQMPVEVLREGSRDDHDSIEGEDRPERMLARTYSLGPDHPDRPQKDPWLRLH